MSADRRSSRSIAVAILLAGLVPVSCVDRSMDDVVRLSGRIEAPTVDLAPRITGRVVDVLAREGDPVESGALLVKLDLGDTALAVDRERASVAVAEARLRDLELGSRQPEIAAALAQVADRRAELELARSNHERQATLLAKEVGSQRDYDKAEADLERARAALDVAREQLTLLQEGFREWQTEQARREVERAGVVLRQAETNAAEDELRAPADGVVLHRIAEPGLLLAPGQTALTLAFRDRLYVRVFIPEPQLGRVKQGAAARVRVDAFPGRDFPGRVTEVSPDAEFTPKPVDTRDERVNLVYAAKVELDRGWQEPLVPGQPADVTIEAGPRGR
jgi:HlyD family secretion protein